MPPPVQRPVGLGEPVRINVHGSLLRWKRVQRVPHLHDASPARGEHAVLQRVEGLPVDRRHEAAGDEAEEHAGGEVVLADAVAHLEVLVEHSRESKRYRLDSISLSSSLVGLR